jgi:DNA-binding NtrC family response regulator
MGKHVIYLLDWDRKANQQLRQYLSHQGFEVVVSNSSHETLDLFQKAKPDLAILDASGDCQGESLEVAKLLRQQYQSISVILIVRESSEKKIIAALRAGVNDYFRYPFSYDELLDSIWRHLKGAPAAASASLEKEPGPCFIGETPSIRKVKDLIVRAAATDCNVLITGETGTGKEKVAELIHWHSSRRKQPLICINCAALPENLLESELFGYERGAFTGASGSYSGKLRLAEGGTVLLDEIFEMSPHMQAKILRVLDTREIYSLGGKAPIFLDIRVLAATNQDPESCLEQGSLRKDLFYRLNVARVHLPPLRERPSDIPLLLYHFLGEMNSRYGRQVEGFTVEALEVLLGYSWPGNIRELKSLMEAWFINLPPKPVTLLGLPNLPEFFQRLKARLHLPQGEREQLLRILQQTNWNKSQTAQELQISRKTLYRKLEKYEIQAAKIHKM